MKALQLFDGFPYLTTRVVPALYHVILLPADRTDAELLELSRAQVAANRLQSCLVLRPDRGVFLEPDGSAFESDTPAAGGLIIAGLLVPVVEFEKTDELQARQARLDAVVEASRAKGGFVAGDLRKGGRAVTDEDRKRLGGWELRRPRKGLEPCATCGVLRGKCLDDIRGYGTLVVTVQCDCDNHNRCARCGGLLCAERLNGNRYNAADGQVWHNPGFRGFSHRCGTAVADSSLADEVAKRRS